MDRKAQGISVNVIIIAAIALIVLIILVAVFTGRFGIFSKSLDNCPGICGDSSDCKSPNIVMSQYKCPDSSSTGSLIKISVERQVCCMKSSK